MTANHAGPPPPRTTGLPPQARALLPLVLPALAVGIGSSLVLLVLSWVSARLQHFLWTWIPGRLDIPDSSRGWTIAVLAATGIAVGLLIRCYPGLAGPDPATLGLVDPPQPLRLLPGVAAATVLALAGGVSLGPENPITAINIALCFHLGRKLMPGIVPAAWVGLAAAGTIGALFGTPVAAALILSEANTSSDPRPLWDRLFAPLLAAGSGALTTVVVANPSFTVDVPAYPGFHWGDAFTGMAVAAVAALLGLAAVHAFPPVHRLFHRLRHPVAILTAGGLVLGLLGALGGRISLFKGLDEVKELTAHVTDHSTGNLLLLTLVKLAALVVAASAGFWGGRIFPAVFVGVALGLFVQRLFPSIPLSLAVTCGVLGILLATTRQGWLSLFTAAVLTQDLRLLPVLCVASLPAWLLVTGRPEMLIPKPTRPAAHAAPAPGATTG